MIIRSKAPLRIGLAGGGTDLPIYSDQFTGFVLNTTIDMYVHCSIIPKDSGCIEFYSQDLQEGNQYPLQTQIDFDGHLDLYKAIYNRLVKDFEIPVKPFKLMSFSEAPAGSGLGGSSTLVVAILKAFDEWLELGLGVYDIARLAYQIERVDLGFAGGQQDQYAATFGGFNFMEFSKGLNVVVNPLGVKNWIINEFEASSFVCFSGISRESAHIIDAQKKSISNKSQNVLSELHKLKENAFKMKNCLVRGDVAEVADLVKAAWDSKKRTSVSISNPHIDNIIKKADEYGIKSCKVSGAGGGGFIFFMVDPILKASAMRKLASCNIDVRNVSYTNKGCQAWVVE
ncbi:MAG: dehydrogenase [Gammaproteobacteria bacterium]|nr:dehydrogenase [Gammaproteobacteria bacterium]